MLDNVGLPMLTKIGDVPLHDRAMMARLHIKCPTFRKTDSKIAKEVAAAKGSDADMHTHRRRILAKTAMADIQKIIGEARGYHEENTLPWEDDGQRILTSESFDDYMSTMNRLESKFYTAVNVFVPAYPSLILDAKALLGDTFNEKDYPDPLRIGERFYFKPKVSQVTTDFRCSSLSDEDQERIRHEIEQRTNEALAGATQHLFEEMFKHVEHMVERLAAFEEREQKTEEERAEDRTGVFRDSLVNNIKEFVNRLPKLNLTGDPKIEELRQRCLRTLCAHKPEDLRTSPLTRAHVLTQAQAIRAAVSELI